VHRKQAAEYRAKQAALDTREHALAEDQARVESEARSPRAILTWSQGRVDVWAPPGVPKRPL
jgi:hypothetical protein